MLAMLNIYFYTEVLFILFYIVLFLVKARNATALEGTASQPRPSICCGGDVGV